jgi:tetratricopeptide (TPR) repeat protein
MDWEEISRGLVANQQAFSRLGSAERLAELNRGIDWAIGHQHGPACCHKVTSTIISLLDIYDIRDEKISTTAALLLGVAAAGLGRDDEAILQFRQVLNQADSPLTGDLRIEAAMALANQLFIKNGEPEEPSQLLRRVLVTARAQGKGRLAANASISFGALLRKSGRLEEAREVYEEGIAYGEVAADTAVLARLHGNLANLVNSKRVAYSRRVPI